jgi:hypothetical protein
MKRIVVLHRGWVVVGDYQATENEIVISEASVIRCWGTERGLGELAAEGPRPHTVLDACGTVRAHPLGVVLTIDCEASKW